MADPVVAQKGPYERACAPGEYWWCACGLSKAQPYCDGSHKGTGISPVHVVLENAETKYWCGCKQSASKPFCDGTHKRL